MAAKQEISHSDIVIQTFLTLWECGHQMDGWPLHARLCTHPEISLESNFVQTLQKVFQMRLRTELSCHISKSNLWTPQWPQHWPGSARCLGDPHQLRTLVGSWTGRWWRSWHQGLLHAWPAVWQCPERKPQRKAELYVACHFKWMLLLPWMYSSYRNLLPFLSVFNMLTDKSLLM